MVKLIRYLLFPFAILYGGIVALRNFLFDKNILKSSEFDVKTIQVGNLSAGGTGKTPHIEYLIRFLKEEFKITTLSRGYGRKSTGFIVADDNSTAKEIGDEPLQFHKKFEEIERFLNSEMTEGEQTGFEKEIAQDRELAKTVALYKDLPNHLNNIQGDLDFNTKLQSTRDNYSQTSSNPTSWKWLVIGIFTIVVSNFFEIVKSPLGQFSNIDNSFINRHIGRVMTPLSFEYSKNAFLASSEGNLIAFSQ
mgnify:CR=1 FL=1